jgi:hypothetical protein
MPERISSSWRLETFATSSVSNSRSRVMICDTLATESFGSPVVRAGRRTLPGASVQRRLLVKGTQTMVLMRLRFNVSPWTTRTGLRKPGLEPAGFGRSAQYTCPWAITIQWLQACVWPRRKSQDQAGCPFHRRGDSLRRSLLQDRAARYILLRLPSRPGCEIFSSGATGAQLPHKRCQGSKLPFSYPKYNHRAGSWQLLAHVLSNSQRRKPAELTVEQRTKFEPVMKLKPRSKSV